MSRRSTNPTVEQQRRQALDTHARELYAEKARQLFDASSAMHRWVMASLLLLNTSAIALALATKVDDPLEHFKVAIATWAVGACFAIFSGSVRSDADLINSYDWLELSSARAVDLSAPGRRDRALVLVLRLVATSMQFVSAAAFAFGLEWAT